MPLRIGIDLGGTKIEGILLDAEREAARIRIDTPRTYVQTLDAILEVVATLEASRPDRLSAPPSVGVGIPGAVSPGTGRVKNANSTWLIGQPLGADLESRLRRPVRIANDANCLAISEATDGAGAGAAVVFGVIVGTGTGGGLVVRGEVLSGANAIAGEWGHNPLPWPNEEEMRVPACYCGRTGCIETFLSGPGLARDHERRTGDRLAPAEIVRRADRGEIDALLTLDLYEQRMARALAGVINLLDPDVIVLGGGLSNIDRLYANVPRLWTPYVFNCDVSQPALPDPRWRDRETAGHAALTTRLVAAQHGDASGVRGAAWLWPGGRDRGSG